MNKLRWLLLYAFFIVLLTGCSTTYKNQSVISKTFPTIKGTTLTKQSTTLPEHFSGRHVIVLIGYKQNSQFDIDRWILGLTDSDVKTPVYELPAAVGMIPRMISDTINSGMRSGIPKELWVDVITLYGENSKKLAQFTGNEFPLNARVMLLDPGGKILFFHDRGYAVPFLKNMIKLIPKNN